MTEAPRVSGGAFVLLIAGNFQDHHAFSRRYATQTLIKDYRGMNMYQFSEPYFGSSG